MTRHALPVADDVWSGWLPNRGHNPVAGMQSGEYAIRVAHESHEFMPDCKPEDNAWGLHYVTHYRYKWRAAMRVMVQRISQVQAQQGDRPC